MSHRIRLGIVALTLASCSGEASPPADTSISRPVTVALIVESPPAAVKRLSGIVKPQREEQVAFEVSGRVDFVIDVGHEFQGPTIDANGKVVTKGEIIARLDPTRYRQALDAAELRLASARFGLKAQQLEIDQVAKSELDQAIAKANASKQHLGSTQSQERLAKSTLERTQGLFDSQTASQQRLDEAKSNYDNAAAALRAAQSDVDAASAAVATSRARKQLLLAQLEKTKAEINELEQAKVQSQQNLTDCELRAPFSGRITERLIGRGGYVQTGAPVVTLTMMDPVKVSVMVTSEQSRELLPGRPALLYPEDLGRFTQQSSLVGHVFAKAEVADAATRTYIVDLVVRNLRRRRFLHGQGGKKVYAVDRIMPVLKRQWGDEGPVFVSLDCLPEDGSYVYRIPGLRMGDSKKPNNHEAIRPEKIDIKLETELLTIGRWRFQQVSSQALAEGDLLICGPKPEQLEGVAIARDDWALRPGDIVPVSFESGGAQQGLWAPRDAIRNQNGKASVFAVDAKDRVVRVPVELFESSGSLQRIKGEGLGVGTQLVIAGLHYIANGDPVSIVSELGK